MSTIQVENPATGRIVASVPAVGPDQLPAMVARARAAQAAWAAQSFEARGRVMLRARRWMFDNSRRVLRTVMDETGKTHEDAQLTDFGYTVAALGFWARHAGGYLADERVRAWETPYWPGDACVSVTCRVGSSE